VKDEPVSLARERADPRRHVVVAEPDGTYEQVESMSLSSYLYAPIDDVDEEKALVLTLEKRFACRPPKDDPDHLFEAVGKRSRRPVAHEAELPHRTHDPVASFGPRGALAVEDSRHRGDRHAGTAGDVIDGEGPLGFLRLWHRACCSSLWTVDCRRLGKRLPVSAYRTVSRLRWLRKGIF
jgi:hypothetical protein